MYDLIEFIDTGFEFWNNPLIKINGGAIWAKAELKLTQDISSSLCLQPNTQV